MHWKGHAVYTKKNPRLRNASERATATPQRPEGENKTNTCCLQQVAHLGLALEPDAVHEVVKRGALARSPWTQYAVACESRL
jgi:hypothetical protein